MKRTDPWKAPLEQVNSNIEKAQKKIELWTRWGAMLRRMQAKGFQAPGLTPRGSFQVDACMDEARFPKGRSAGSWCTLRMEDDCFKLKSFHPSLNAINSAFRAHLPMAKLNDQEEWEARTDTELDEILDWILAHCKPGDPWGFYR